MADYCLKVMVNRIFYCNFAAIMHYKDERSQN